MRPSLGRNPQIDEAVDRYVRHHPHLKPFLDRRRRMNSGPSMIERVLDCFRGTPS